MTIRFGTGAAIAAIIALAACNPIASESEEVEPTPAPAPAESEPVVPEPAPEEAPQEETLRTAAATSKKAIDWEAARRDLASTPRETDTTFNVQSGDTAPPVPVLLPSGPVRTASAGGPQPQFRPVSDGYFAVFPGETYNLIVNGTNEVTDVPGMENSENSEMKFSETTTGAIVSFSRYGADYMIEFECLGSGEEGGSCVTEDEALEVAEEIVISGTQ